jgi:hypothetical protein
MAEKHQGLNYDEFQTRSSDYSSQDGRNNPNNRPISDVSPAEARRIRLKIDTRLVVLVGFMYCISLMDRTNLANAKVAGYVDLNPFRLGRLLTCRNKVWRNQGMQSIQRPKSPTKDWISKALDMSVFLSDFNHSELL